MSGFDPIHLAEGAYHFPRPIRRVAVIGGGPSGLATARHLKESGIHPRIFERQAVVGGTWNFDPAVATTLQDIRPAPSVGDYTPSLPPGDKELPITERKKGGVKSQVLNLSMPPPVYDSLKNNICLPLMQLKDFPWPSGLTWNEPHYVLAKYLQDYAAHFGLDDPDVLSVSSRVESVRKRPSGEWRLTLKRVTPVDGADQAETSWWTEDFDAVVSASGHYSAPSLPQTPGLQGLWDKYKTSQGQEVLHSKAYRFASGYKDKNVLLVGCGTSGIDINNDISQVANQVYHSVREQITENVAYRHLREKQREAISKPNSRAVAEVKAIRPASHGEEVSGIAVFELADGTMLTDVDKVIYCTGYQISKPYLAQFHVDDPSPEELLSLDHVDESFASQLKAEKAHPSAIFTNGRWYQNLWEDILYRLDPTLAFVGAPVGTATFSFFEFQGIALAHVYSGKARIPTEKNLESLYVERLRTKGPGRNLQLMGEELEIKYVASLVHWLNAEGNHVQGHIPNFGAIRRYSTQRILANFVGDRLPPKSVTDLYVPPDRAEPTTTTTTTTTTLAPVESDRRRDLPLHSGRAVAISSNA